MKKIMFIAALAFGLAASGSTVNWTINGGVAADPFAGGTAYLVWIGSGTTTPNAGGGYEVGDQTSFDIANVIGASDSVVDSVAVGEGGAVASSAAWHESTGRQGFYAVVISDDGKSMMIATNRKTATINASDDQSANLTWTTANMGSTYEAYVAPTPDPGGIPEPTSGLLMLVGLGALALRRRRA